MNDTVFLGGSGPAARRTIPDLAARRAESPTRHA